MTPQQEYDALYEKEFLALYKRLQNSPSSAKNKAGVSMLMATFAISTAAAYAGKMDSILGRAPYQSQIDEILTLLREVLVVGDRPKPKLAET